jgi:hypothetical protein
MIANGGSMKCGGRCENVRLQIGQYHLKYHMFAIEMGGCEFFLSVEWLRIIGPILMDFNDLTMKLQQERQQYKFQGIIVGSPKITSSLRMENILKKGHLVIIVQLRSIHVVELSYVHLDLQSILSLHQVVFTTPKELTPSCGVHDHSIPLILGSLPPMFILIVTPFPRRMKLRKLFMNY